MTTNTERAQKADRVVSNYESDSSLEECLSDLLGDLRHFCDAHGIDFAERDRVGHRNYTCEIAKGGVVAHRPHIKVEVDTVIADNGADVALVLLSVAHEIMEGRTTGAALLHGSEAAIFSTHYAG